MNEKIETDRLKLVGLMRRSMSGKRLSTEDQQWLKRLTDVYELKALDYKQLLWRHDIIPPSLALGQAIIESGWGTSRFAQQGNAVFGQWTFKKGSGIIPQDRDVGKRHEVKAFRYLEESVFQYVLNLNRHLAYREFRTRRASMRVKGKTIDGYSLASTLTRYSERGKSYVLSLRGVMRTNKLSYLDDVRLRGLSDG